jgi:DNA modification methylase
MRNWIELGVKVHTCVTSPPYFGLRDYKCDGQIGLEKTPDEYIATLVDVFRHVRELLVDDGTLWVNIGDSYASTGGHGGIGVNSQRAGRSNVDVQNARKGYAGGDGIKTKDLIGIPWMLAFALRADGWYLRQDIIWCLSGGAWVYARTQKGDMPVMVKDLVRLDPSTVKLWNGEKWTQVLGWGQSNDTSQRIELVLRSGERMGCTGGHLWPTQRGNVAARELVVGDVIQTCRLPEPSNAKRPAYLSDGLLWLIGLYLAEGSRSGDTIQLSLHGDEKPWVPLIDMAAEQVGATLSYSEEGNCLNVRLYGKVLNAVIDEYIGGRTAIDKHLTTKAWMLPDDALRLIAQGYMHGDGHEDGNRVRLGFCRNYALERDLRTLAARLGATLTLNPCEATYQGGKKPAFRGEWRWERTGHHNEKDRGEIVEIRASRARQFWDIAVEDEPHLFSLASGVLTHNCKPNPMPESVRDRCTKAHEYVFLLSKGPRYFFDSDAIKEPSVCAGDIPGGKGHYIQWKRSLHPAQRGHNKDGLVACGQRPVAEKRNRRSVWTIATKPYKGAHFATFPEKLIEPCILAGAGLGDVVLDPFMGSGTTAAVAKRLGCYYMGCELNPENAPLIAARLS